ncbi:MAG: MarR family transcriptional regulator [Deltaproteobacteria bacterium]|nr:MarR family transcriptional regulator [Deltaproteobacteria bacterium]MBW2503448.1 MarR family transcriptional regulator [Deltaproteobacteria bacterium]MBW2520420.1 MarR family transcriptional regulator [Deltaproteobacteria bacterium]
MAVKELARKIVEFYEKLSSWEHEVVRGSDLTPSQMHAIEIIGHEKTLRMKELAEKLGVTTGTLTVTVDRLEQKGLIERQPHETDRRSYRVILTPSGKKYFAKHHEYHVKLTEEIVSALTPEELECFNAVLGKVVKQF